MTKIFNQLRQDNRGAIALLTVVIVSAAVLIMAVGASRLGLGESDFGYTEQKGGEALSVADACVEETLRQLRLNSNYTDGSITLDNGSCTMSVSGGGSSRTVVVESTVVDYHKSLQVSVMLTDGNITINSWDEI